MRVLWARIFPIDYNMLWSLVVKIKWLLLKLMTLNYECPVKIKASPSGHLASLLLHLHFILKKSKIQSNVLAVYLFLEGTCVINYIIFRGYISYGVCWQFRILTLVGETPMCIQTHIYIYVYRHKNKYICLHKYKLVLEILLSHLNFNMC